MTKTFKDWKQSLSIKNQLFVSFLINIIFWFVFPLAFDLLLWRTDRPIEYFAFSAPFSAFFWTIFYNWRKVKGLLKKTDLNNHEEIVL